MTHDSGPVSQVQIENVYEYEYTGNSSSLFSDLKQQLTGMSCDMKNKFLGETLQNRSGC